MRKGLRGAAEGPSERESGREERERERGTLGGERDVRGLARRGGFPTAQCRYPLSTGSLAL